MSHDLAILGVRVDSRDVERGRRDLEAFTRSGRRAGASGQQMGQDFERGAARAQRATHTLAGSMRGLMRVARMAGGAMAAIGAAQLLGESIRQARGFGTAMAEVSTITSGGAGEMSKLREAARDMAKEFGTSAADQAKGLYQAISAGATDASEAIRLMDTANKLAIGGLTDTATAVRVLSGVMNAYGRESITAAQAADALFVGVRAGETNVGELSSAIGRVLPMAKALGMSFDEAVGATAALTKNAMTTAEAVTSLNAILTAVAKPTTQAADLAKDLSLEFGAAALQAQGFAGFMANIEQATGGNVEQMATLLGSVEAVKAGLLFAGEAGLQYAEIMEAMSAKAGAASTAFGKMSEDMQNRLNKVSSAFSDLKLSIGALALELAVPVLETLVHNIDTLGIGLVALASSQIPAAITGMVSLTAWLATSEGLFIAGAVAARGMAIAMNTIPWVAAASLAMGAYAAYKKNRQIAADLAEALEGASEAQLSLNEAVARFEKEATLRSATAMRDAARQARDELQEALEGARRSRDRAEVPVWLGGDEAHLKAMEQNVTDLSGALMDAEAKMSAAEAALNRLANSAATAADDLNKPIRSIGDVVKLAERMSSVSVPAAANIAELAREYGTLAGAAHTVARAQHEMAFAEVMGEAARLQEGLGALAFKVRSTTGEMGQMAAAVDALQHAQGPEELAKAFARVAEEVEASAGGIENMDDETGQLHQSIISVVNKLIEAAQAAREGEGAAAGFAGGLANAAAQAAQLAANLGAAALGAEKQAEVGLARIQAQIEAVRAGQNENIAGARAVLQLEIERFTVAQRNAGLSASEAALAADAHFRNQTALIEWQEKLDKTREEYGKLGKAAAGAGRAAARGASTAAEAMKKLRQEAERWRSRTATPVEKYRKAMADLKKLYDRNLIGAKTYRRAVEDLNKELGAGVPLVDDLANAFGDWVSRGFRDFKGFTQSVWQSFQSLISRMIATAARNRILISLGMAGSPTAAAAGGGGGGGGGFISSLMGTALGTWGGTTGIMGGLSTAWGGLTSGGLSGMFTGMGAAFATGPLAALGAALPIIGVGLALFAAFRTKTKELDAGIDVHLRGLQATAQKYQVLQKSQFFGLSRWKETRRSAAGADIVGPLQQAYGQLQQETRKTAAMIGTSTSALDRFRASFKMTTKGKSAEQVQRELAEWVQGVNESLAREIYKGAQALHLLRPGEGAAQALREVAVSLEAVNAAFSGLGLRTISRNIFGADRARNILEHVGGVQKFGQASDTYLQAFYSAQERADKLADKLRDGLGISGVAGLASSFLGTGYSLPQTMQEYRQAVERLSAQGDSFRAAKMISLAPMFQQWQQLREEVQRGVEAERQAAERAAEAARKASERLTKSFRLSNDYRTQSDAQLAQIAKLRGYEVDHAVIATGAAEQSRDLGRMRETSEEQGRVMKKVLSLLETWMIDGTPKERNW